MRAGVGGSTSSGSGVHVGSASRGAWLGVTTTETIVDSGVGIAAAGPGSDLVQPEAARTQTRRVPRFGTGLLMSASLRRFSRGRSGSACPQQPFRHVQLGFTCGRYGPALGGQP